MCRRALLLAAIAAAPFLSLPTQAALALKGANKTTTVASPGELQSLQQAYAILEKADHDYKGHRMKAMHSIEAACKELGGSAHGEGSGHEAQAASDSQLHQAQTLLESARGTATAGSHSRVLHHINHAIQELSVALSVK